MLSSLLLVVAANAAFQATPPPAVSSSHLTVPANVAQQADSPKVTPELRGDIMMARKMYREAIDKYKEAPNSAVILNKIGIAYHQLIELNLAKKYYERAIKLDRNYSEAVNNLGTVYYAQKSYKRSISQYKKALRIAPDSAAVLSNLGTAYFARKNYELASAAFQRAVELDPEVFERHNSQGELLQERSVEERAKFHYYLAKTYAKAGKNDLALLYIRKALEEGFKERDKFIKEPEFVGLREDPEFKKLMATEQKVL